ncbi:MAG: response regulator transcription factor [Pseudomonadota bacterium]|nr:response regulator transcription factor [Pseudomonadota bacterium]
MRLLIIEDDDQAAAYLAKGLKESGFAVDHAADGNEGLYMALSEPYDALIVDRMLPRRDGLSVIAVLRAQGTLTPVLILSALGEIGDRVRGLRAGGDDYLVKPYAFAELLARVEALLRRGGTVTDTILRVADLELDLLAHSVKRAGRIINLQPGEFRLLECLMRHSNQVVTRTILLEHVTPLLHTVRGTGYCLRGLA